MSGLYNMDAGFECVSTEERIKRGEIVGITLPEFNTFAAQRGGRGSNGYERDRGAVLHAVVETSANDVAYGHQKALCGVAPGRRSTGWSCTVKDADNVNCLRCLKRSASFKTIPDAESKYRAEHLDRALPQAAPLAASRRF